MDHLDGGSIAVYNNMKEVQSYHVLLRRTDLSTASEHPFCIGLIHRPFLSVLAAYDYSSPTSEHPRALLSLLVLSGNLGPSGYMSSVAIAKIPLSYERRWRLVLRYTYHSTSSLPSDAKGTVGH